MTAALTASFVLKLEDKLSAGIVALTKKLEALSKLARGISMPGLTSAPAQVAKVAQAATQTTTALQRLTTTAQAAATAIRGIGSGGSGGFAQIRAGAAGLRRELRGTVAHARELGAQLREIGHGVLAAGATGFGLNHVIHGYAEQENTLRHIAITAGVPQAQIAPVVGGLDRQYNALALGSGQSSAKIAEAANFLITTGIGRGAVDELLPTVARASTAYNANIGDSVQSIFSLKENLHVRDEDLPGTISALAVAGKEGHFSFADFSRFLPEVAPLAANAGLSGAGGVRDLAAMFETSRRNAGTSGEAATNLRDFLSHIFGDQKRGLGASFATHGVNLTKLLLDAEKKGISAPEAVLEQVRRLTQGKTDFTKNQIIGSLFHNQQSASFVRGALNDLPYLQELREKLRHADAGTIDSDFNKAADAPLVKLRLIEEKLTQLSRRFGEGFSVLLGPFNTALDGVMSGLDRLEAKLHAIFGKRDGRRDSDSYEDPVSYVNRIIGYMGGFLVFTAAMGLLVPVLRLLRTGIVLLLAPLRLLLPVFRVLGGALRLIGAGALWLLRGLLLVATAIGVIVGLPVEAVVLIGAAIAAAALAIYSYWTPIKAFFIGLWEGIKAAFIAFATWIGGWATSGVEAVKAGWEAAKGIFTDIVAEWMKPLDAFITAAQAKIAALRNSAVGQALGLGKEEYGPPAPGAAGPSTAGDGLKVGLPQGFRAAAATSAEVHVTVGVDPNGRLTVPSVTSSNPGTVTVDRGRMRDRD